MGYLLAKGLFIIAPAVVVPTVMQFAEDMQPEQVLLIECTKEKKVHLKYTIPEV